MSAKHGHTAGGRKSPTYSSWQAMRRRCYDRKFEAYQHYGAVGVRVAPRWLKFESFLADMGIRPAGHDLSRLNDVGNYEPGNCQWKPAVDNQARQAYTSGS